MGKKLSLWSFGFFWYQWDYLRSPAKTKCRVSKIGHELGKVSYTFGKLRRKVNLANLEDLQIWLFVNFVNSAIWRGGQLSTICV